MVAELGNLQESALGRLLQTTCSSRTAEWVEPEKPSLTKATQIKAAEVDSLSLYLPISKIYSGTSARHLDITQQKQKNKPRGQPRSEPATQPEVLHQANPNNDRPTFSVDACT